MRFNRRHTLIPVLAVVLACGGRSPDGEPARDVGAGFDAGLGLDASQLQEASPADVVDVADVSDVGPSDAGPSCFAAAASQHDCLHHWRFVGDDGLTELALLLLPDPLASPTKGTDAFTLAGAAGTHPAGGRFCITDPADLSYQVTHHNLEDSATVIHGDFELSYQESWSLEGKSFGLRVLQRSTSQPVLDLALQKVDCSAAGRDAAQPSCLSCRSKCCS